MPSPTLPATRRNFLKLSAAGATLMALPAGVYRAAFAADGEKPSERVRIGCIGIGGQGKGNMGKYLKGKSVTAVCDVDLDRLAAAAGAVEKESGKAPFSCPDFQFILDRKDVDAVVVSTPDHWHALNTILACQAGQGRVLREAADALRWPRAGPWSKAARKNKRIVQTGSQQRSGKEFRQACELVRNGAIGKVQAVKVGLPGPNWISKAKMPVPDSEPPAGLNYDIWLGPAPDRPYNKNRVHYLFRFFWDYSRRPADELRRPPPRHRAVGPRHGRQRPRLDRAAPRPSTRTSGSRRRRRRT